MTSKDSTSITPTFCFDYELINEMESYRALNIAPRTYLTPLSDNNVICCPDPRVPEIDNAILINLVSKIIINSKAYGSMDKRHSGDKRKD